MNTIKTLVSLAAIALVATGCATTPEEQQSEAEKADHAFGRMKIYIMVANVGVAGYNVACAGALKSSTVCADGIRNIVNTSSKAASDAIVSAEKVFAAGNSTLDAKMKAVNIATTLINELIAALNAYAPQFAPKQTS